MSAGRDFTELEVRILEKLTVTLESISGAETRSDGANEGQSGRCDSRSAVTPIAPAPLPSLGSGAGPLGGRIVETVLPNTLRCYLQIWVSFRERLSPVEYDAP